MTTMNHISDFVCVCVCLMFTILMSESLLGKSMKPDLKIV